MAKDEPTSTPAQTPAPAKSGKYAKASESGDPAVHQLLAQRDILQTNRAVIEPEGKLRDEQLAGIDSQLKEITKQLNDLGYE